MIETIYYRIIHHVPFCNSSFVAGEGDPSLSALGSPEALRASQTSGTPEGVRAFVAAFGIVRHGQLVGFLPCEAPQVAKLVYKPQ